MITTNQLMPPMLESAPATAWRLRRRLADLHPDTAFRVQTKRRSGGGADLHVTWTGAPSVDAIARLAEVFARTVEDRSADATLWADDRGAVALVYPGAERVELRREPGPGGGGADAARPPMCLP